MKTNKLDTAGYLTPEEIVEFQRLVKDAMGRDITLEEAEDQGSRMIMLLEAIAKQKAKHS